MIIINVTIGECLSMIRERIRLRRRISSSTLSKNTRAIFQQYYHQHQLSFFLVRADSIYQKK
jgi:hypothetical protein